MKIVIDWDGTLVEEKWPECGGWLPDAIYALHMLNQEHDLVISSCRIATIDVDGTVVPTAERLRRGAEMRSMLDKAGLEDVEIWTEHGKPRGDLYIDDRGMRFEGNWLVTMRNIFDLERKNVHV